MVHGEAIDDIVALTALIAFHRVDGDMMQHVRPIPVDGMADSGNLVAVGHYHAHCSLGNKIIPVEQIYVIHRGSYHASLHIVGLGRGGHPYRRRGHKHDTVGSEHAQQSVGRLYSHGRLQLMGERYRPEHVLVESMIGKIGYVGVHAPLTGEHVHETFVIAPVRTELCQQPFKQRKPAVGEMNGIEQGIVHARFLGRLLHHGRQLFVVTDEDKPVDGAGAFPLCRQQSDEVVFQNL